VGDWSQQLRIHPDPFGVEDCSSYLGLLEAPLDGSHSSAVRAREQIGNSQRQRTVLVEGDRVPVVLVHMKILNLADHQNP